MPNVDGIDAMRSASARPGCTMRDELIDRCRRELRDDLARRLADSGIDAELGEHVAGDAHALLDALLIDFQTAELDRHDLAVVGEHLFCSAWPRILLHVLPAVARSHGAPGRVVERLSLVQPGLVASD